MKFSAFALDHALSYRLMTTSAAARGTYFALVNLAFREGWAQGGSAIIPGGARDLASLARATGLRVPELRGAIREGLVEVQGDDLRLEGAYAENLTARGLPEVGFSSSARRPLTAAQLQQRTQAAHRRWGTMPSDGSGLRMSAPEAPHADSMRSDAANDAERPAAPMRAGDVSDAELPAEEGGRGENSKLDNSEHQNSESTLTLGSNRDFETRARVPAGVRRGADVSAGAPLSADVSGMSPDPSEERRRIARNSLARALRRHGLAYTSMAPGHPDPLQEWADFLQGVVGAKNLDDALLAFGAVMAEARARGLQVQFARHVASLAAVGVGALARRRTGGGA